MGCVIQWVEGNMPYLVLVGLALGALGVLGALFGVLGFFGSRRANRRLGESLEEIDTQLNLHEAGRRSTSLLRDGKVAWHEPANKRKGSRREEK